MTIFKSQLRKQNIHMKGQSVEHGMKKAGWSSCCLCRREGARLRRGVCAAAFHDETSLWGDLFSSREPIKYLRKDNPATASRVLNQHQNVL